MKKEGLDPIGAHLALALDGMTLKEAINRANEFAGQVAILKVNDLIADEGSKEVIKRLASLLRRGGIWSDLKSCDTDSTMGNTIKKIGINGARIASVHLLEV